MPRLHSVHHRTRAAFSLVELSISLVIIGLLVGGVIVGKSLIKNSELQTIVTDLAKYKMATTEFKKQYGALPGDMGDATSFWGQSTSCGGAVANGTCNGDADGTIEAGAGASVTGEMYQFWRQLVLAGRITGSYSGIAGSSAATHSIAGTNVPASRILNGAWEVGYRAPGYVGNANTYAVDYGNYLRIGGVYAGDAANTPLLTPEDAWKIDTKSDDGMPATGTIVASHWNSACATSTTAADLTGTYNLASSAVQCTLYFVRQF